MNGAVLSKTEIKAWVLHIWEPEPPKGVEAYAQEAGRAGRDGEELDTFKDRLHARWLEFNAPLTVGQILMVLEELGWEHHALASIHRCLRALLLTTEQFRRVGADYWIPVEQLPLEIQYSRLQVLPIREPGNWLKETTSGSAFLVPSDLFLLC
jgi:hypothetical protein